MAKAAVVETNEQGRIAAGNRGVRSDSSSF